MIGKYHKRNHGSSEEMTKDELIRYYFPTTVRNLKDFRNCGKKNVLIKDLLFMNTYLPKTTDINSTIK